MWYEILENNFFIKKLYNKVPELKNVNISEINITNEGNKISIICSLPYYADYPPQKWIDSKHNTVFVEIDFFLIQEINIQAIKFDFFKGNIDIFLDENNLINVKITGDPKANFIANSGLIQSVTGCKVSLE
ncbi:hypothetical protein GF322_01960 [Candidatus Dependentiae bacterium]|nr:hypothetical protein [Candidatus Dependentiae bacterium]